MKKKYTVVIKDGKEEFIMGLLPCDKIRDMMNSDAFAEYEVYCHFYDIIEFRKEEK